MANNLIWAISLLISVFIICYTVYILYVYERKQEIKKVNEKIDKIKYNIDSDVKKIKDRLSLLETKKSFE